MLILLLIPILVSGFYICEHDTKYAMLLHRYHGQHLHLKSLQLGFAAVGVAFVVLWLGREFLPDTVSFLKITLPLNVVTSMTEAMDGILGGAAEYHMRNLQLIWIFIWSAVSVALAVLWCRFVNGYLKNHKKPQKGILFAASFLPR